MSQRHPSTTSGSTLQQPYGENQIPHEHFYPPIPMPQQPRMVYIDHRRNMSDGRPFEPTKLQGSVSSSDSSGILAQKQNSYSPQSWPTGMAERTLVNYDGHHQHRQSQGRPFHHNEYRQSHKRLEQTHHTSPALSYIRDRRRLEEEDEYEDEEEDHALWVLVCQDLIICGTSANVCSSGYLA